MTRDRRVTPVETPGSRPSISELARRIRDVQSEGQGGDESRLKASLRRLVHESVVGFTEDELLDFIDGLKSRFPDRSYETAALARNVSDRSSRLQSELSRLETENARLQEQLRVARDQLGRVVREVAAAASRDDQPAVGGRTGEAPTPDPRAVESIVGALGVLIRSILDQETVLGSVEMSVSQSGTTSRLQEPALADILRRLAAGEAVDLGLLDRQLARLSRLPAALLAGVQLSWRSGTRELIEHLSPTAVEKSGAAGKLPGMKERALLKEISRRCDELWNEFDRIIAHYYRGPFERAYLDKMEEGE